MIKHKRLLSLNLQQRTQSIENEMHELSSEFSSLTKLVPELTEVLDKAAQLGDRNQASRKTEQLKIKELEQKFESLLAEKDSLREQDRMTLQKALEQVQSEFNDLTQQHTQLKNEFDHTMTQLNTTSAELAALKSESVARDTTASNNELRELRDKIVTLEQSLIAERHETERQTTFALQLEQRLAQNNAPVRRSNGHEAEVESQNTLLDVDDEPKRHVDEKQDGAKSHSGSVGNIPNSISYTPSNRNPSYSAEIIITIPGTNSMVACGLRVFDKHVNKQGDPQVMEIWVRQFPQPKMSCYITGSQFEPQKALLSKSNYMFIGGLPTQPIALRTGGVTVNAWITQLMFSDKHTKQGFESLTVVFDAQR